MKYLVIVRHGVSHLEGNRRWLDQPAGRDQMLALGFLLKPLIKGVDPDRITILTGNSPHLIHSAHAIREAFGLDLGAFDVLGDLYRDEDDDAPGRIFQEVRKLEPSMDVMVLVTRENLTGHISTLFFREYGIVRGDGWTGILEYGEARIFHNQPADDLCIAHSDPPGLVEEWIRRLQ